MIFGVGGHARSVGDVAIACGYDNLLFIDDSAQVGETILGFPVLRRRPDDLSIGWQCIPATGDALMRKQQFKYVVAQGLEVATLIAPTATIGFAAVVGAGSFVAHHAHVGPLARIGSGCILNTGAVVEHEASIGHFSHVSVNATVAGRSRIGSYCFIGAGATVIDKVEVTDSVVVGAGSVVVEMITCPGTYVGCPARATG